MVWSEKAIADLRRILPNSFVCVCVCVWVGVWVGVITWVFEWCSIPQFQHVNESIEHS